MANQARVIAGRRDLIRSYREMEGMNIPKKESAVCIPGLIHGRRNQLKRGKPFILWSEVVRYHWHPSWCE